MRMMNSKVEAQVAAAFESLTAKPELSSLGLAETGNV
jgi:hypothetical protein